MIIREKIPESKEKMLETKAKIFEKIKDEEKKVNESKEMIMQQYKENLPLYLDKKLEELTKQINEMEPAKGLSTIQINNLLRPKSFNGQKPKYTGEQLEIIFDYYRQALIAVNEKFKYPPSKENFCAFAGISTSTYNSYLLSQEENKQEIMLMIDDYIRENMLTSAQLKEIDNITTMFRGKTEHGLVEAQAPIVIEHHTETDYSKINEMISKLKKGESLKPIELKKSQNGIFKEDTND